MGMNDGLRLASGTRGVQNEQWVFCVHLDGLALAFSDRQLAQLVVPVVTSRVHRNLDLRIAHHNDVLDGRGELHGVIDNLLHGKDLAVNPRTVDGDNDLRLRAINTRVKSLRRIACKNHRMHRTNLGAGQHREKDLRDAGQINGDDIALAHAHRLKNIGHLLDFSVEGEVGKGTHLISVLTDPDKG